MEEMSLSEFMGRTDASDNQDGSYTVTIYIKPGLGLKDELTVKVEDCYTIYDAKERVYWYLREKIENRNGF